MSDLIFMFKNTLRLMREALPPQSRFFPERDIPDLTGKVVIVTGGNTGIGKETVKQLLAKNARVYMASRSESSARMSISELKSVTGKEAIFLNLDLASLDSVSEAAKEFMSKEEQLHILFNSAGVMFPPKDQLTKEGYDLQFGTNVLGHAHFTLSLLPVLLSTAKSSAEGKVRVVNTASSASYHAPRTSIRWDTLTDGPARRNGAFINRTLYAQSKLGNIIFSNELARRYADQGIVSTAVNPGNVKTQLWKHVPKLVMFLFLDHVLHPVQRGALTQLWAGTSPETADFNGRYLVPWARVGEGRKDAKDPAIGMKLWDWIEEQRRGHGE